VLNLERLTRQSSNGASAKCDSLSPMNAFRSLTLIIALLFGFTACQPPSNPEPVTQPLPIIEPDPNLPLQVTLEATGQSQPVYVRATLEVSIQVRGTASTLELLLDDQPLTTLEVKSKLTYTWDSTGSSETSHRLVARASNTAGGTSSAELTVIVDRTAPSILEFSPSDSTTNNPNLKANVTFSEAIQASSLNTSSFVLRSGSTSIESHLVLSDDAKGASLENTNPLPPDTTYQIELTNGITDLAGNPLKSGLTRTVRINKALQAVLGPVLHLAPTVTGQRATIGTDRDVHVNPDGTATVIWQECLFQIFTAQITDTGLKDAVQLSTGPVVPRSSACTSNQRFYDSASSGNGHIAAVWGQDTNSQPGYYNQLDARYRDSNGQWKPSVTLDSLGGGRARVSLNKQGNGQAVWYRALNGQFGIYSSAIKNGVWGAKTLIGMNAGSNLELTLSAGPDFTMLLISGTLGTVFSRTTSSGSWTAFAPLETPLFQTLDEWLPNGDFLTVYRAFKRADGTFQTYERLYRPASGWQTELEVPSTYCPSDPGEPVRLTVFDSASHVITCKYAWRNNRAFHLVLSESGRFSDFAPAFYQQNESTWPPSLVQQPNGTKLLLWNEITLRLSRYQPGTGWLESPSNTEAMLDVAEQPAPYGNLGLYLNTSTGMGLLMWNQPIIKPINPGDVFEDETVVRWLR
jgi:Bacterial Ig-like domain